MDYQSERDKASLKFSVVLVFLGTTVAGIMDGMIEDSTLSTVAIVAVCAVLLCLDRGFRWLVSRRLNKKAEKNGDPIPFGKNNMI
ncbi:MAG: hypothetical protein E7445_04925 [Ruminococcaceae bacterium]|nr:hypothetical protein [Oscillospiraceae bacterium]